MLLVAIGEVKRIAALPLQVCLPVVGELIGGPKGELIAGCMGLLPSFEIDASGIRLNAPKIDLN